MTTESGLIAGDDVLLIIEALDHYIRYGGDPAPYDRQGYDDFRRLAARLKQNMGMSWSEGSRWSLGRVLREEREQFGAAVLQRML